MFKRILNLLLTSGYSRSASAVIANIILSFALFFVARIIYLLINISLFNSLDVDQLCSILSGGVVFDLAGMAYINLLYMLLMLLPFHLKERDGYQSFTKWVFLLFNFAAFAANIADAIYYPFTKRRTTSTVFNEFGNDEGIFKVILDAALSHWYLILLSRTTLPQTCGRKRQG